MKKTSKKILDTFITQFRMIPGNLLTSNTFQISQRFVEKKRSLNRNISDLPPKRKIHCGERKKFSRQNLWESSIASPPSSKSRGHSHKSSTHMYPHEARSRILKRKRETSYSSPQCIKKKVHACVRVCVSAIKHPKPVRVYSISGGVFFSSSSSFL